MSVFAVLQKGAFMRGIRYMTDSRPPDEDGGKGGK